MELDSKYNIKIMDIKECPLIFKLDKDWLLASLYSFISK